MVVKVYLGLGCDRYSGFGRDGGQLKSSSYIGNNIATTIQTESRPISTIMILQHTNNQYNYYNSDPIGRGHKILVTPEMERLGEWMLYRAKWPLYLADCCISSLPRRAWTCKNDIITGIMGIKGNKRNVIVNTYFIDRYCCLTDSNTVNKDQRIDVQVYC